MKAIFPVTSLFILLFMILMGAGCKKEKPFSACGTVNPLTNLEWLSILKVNTEANAEINSAVIILYQWNGGDYIYYGVKITSLHDNPDAIFDCKGNVIFKCGGNQQVNTCSTFFSEAQKIKVLWMK
jgi:hypothetical protein